MPPTNYIQYVCIIVLFISVHILEFCRRGVRVPLYRISIEATASKVSDCCFERSPLQPSISIEARASKVSDAVSIGEAALTTVHPLGTNTVS